MMVMAVENMEETIMPMAQHAYQCSICRRACDVACYIHLDEKGILAKHFKTPFRKRVEI